MKKFAIVVAALVAAVSGMATNGPFCDWYSPWSGSGAPTSWTSWTETTNYWARYATMGGTLLEFAYPKAGDCVRITSSGRHGKVYMESGLSVTGLVGVVLSYGTACNSSLEVRKGAHLHIMAPSPNSNFEGLQVGFSQNSIADLRVLGSIFADQIRVGNMVGSVGEIVVEPGGSIGTRAYNVVVGYDKGRGSILINGGSLTNVAYSSKLQLGTGDAASSGEVTVVSNGFVRVGWNLLIGKAALRVVDSRFEVFGPDWAAEDPVFRLTGGNGTTNGVWLTNSVLNVQKINGYDRNATRMQKVQFQSLGVSTFVQSHSVVTNYGVWFKPEKNEGDALPLVPPRYEIDGGELYVKEADSQGEIKDGYSNGSATSGISAFTNAPMSFTMSLRGAAKVSIPMVNTNVLVSGGALVDKVRTYAVTTNRPHFEFVLSRDGHAPYVIRRQSKIMGMFSVWPEGGMQVLSTNRLPLVRHSSASTTLATADEPQFRAPNTNLWETGTFADVPREWGVTLREEAEVELGADLGDGVSCGWLRLPRRKPETLERAVLRLKVSPGAKTVAEVVAGMAAAGYDAEAVDDGEYNVHVSLIGKRPLVARRSANVMVFDFTTRQDSIAVRDRVFGEDARLLKADVQLVGSGLTLICK